MVRRTVVRLSVLALLATVPVLVHAQEEGISRRKQEKLQARKEKDDAKEVRKEEKRIAKKHLENQDKATRKRMKRHKKRADRHGSNTHRDPWPGRWFSR